MRKLNKNFEINNYLNWEIELDDDLKYIYKHCKKDFEKLSHKKILFTGGAGFLGYYFTHIFSYWNLKHKNKKIFYTFVDLKSVNIKDWKDVLDKNKEIKFIKKNINLVNKNFLSRFDIVIHGASIASPSFYRARPIDTMKANILGLWNILKYYEDSDIKKNKKKILFFFSSSEVYGNPNKKNIPTKETYFGNVSFFGPRACYDESKRFGETLILNYSEIYKFKSIIVRPFNNYGPGMHINDKRVVPDLFKNIIKNKNIDIFSNGKPTRTFCYIADAIIGYIKALTRGKSKSAYNIGSASPETSILKISKLAKKIAKTTIGYSKNIVFKKNLEKEYLTDNPQRRIPDVKKAITELKFKSKINLETGLKKSLIYFLHNYN